MVSLLAAQGVAFLLAPTIEAKSGCCSSHGGVNCSTGAQANGHVICIDGNTGSSCLYSEMVKCGGSSTSTATYTPPPAIVATPIPTKVPTPKPTSIPTPEPTASSIPIPTMEAISSSTQSPEESSTPTPTGKVQGSQSTNNSSSAGDTVTTIGTLSGLAFGGYKFAKRKFLN